MLDIIIPTYKNKEGLRRTLKSINRKLLPEIVVTIIDDFSELDYRDIFEEFPFVQIFYNTANIGPGLTRQIGINATTESYITFIDTDDYFISESVQENMLNTIRDNPEIELFTWQYQYESNKKISGELNNRMHGRVYKREFISKYELTFCPESSYANEDIGFNRLCRLIIKDKNIKTLTFKEPVIVYTVNKNSLTHKDNDAFFYSRQNIGLSLNAIHYLKIAKKNKVDSSIMLEEINILMASCYYIFLCVVHERPEYLQESWDGAKLFFSQVFIKTPNNTATLIQQGYNVFIKNIFARKKSWKKSLNINYAQFLNDLIKYNEVPSWYKIYD